MICFDFGVAADIDGTGEGELGSLFLGPSKSCTRILVVRASWRITELEKRRCQSNANQSPNFKIMSISRRPLTPFGQGGGSVLFEFVATTVSEQIRLSDVVAVL